MAHAIAPWLGLPSLHLAFTAGGVPRTPRRRLPIGPMLAVRGLVFQCWQGGLAGLRRDSSAGQTGHPGLAGREVRQAVQSRRRGSPRHCRTFPLDAHPPHPRRQQRPTPQRLTAEQRAFSVGHLGLAHQQARRFATRHGLAYNDVLSADHEWFCKAGLGFDLSLRHRPSSDVVPKVKESCSIICVRRALPCACAIAIGSCGPEGEIQVSMLLFKPLRALRRWRLDLYLPAALIRFFMARLKPRDAATPTNGKGPGTGVTAKRKLSMPTL